MPTPNKSLKDLLAKHFDVVYVKNKTRKRKLKNYKV
jgi:hypothetical protein